MFNPRVSVENVLFDFFFAWSLEPLNKIAKKLQRSWNFVLPVQVSRKPWPSPHNSMYWLRRSQAMWVTSQYHIVTNTNIWEFKWENISFCVDIHCFTPESMYILMLLYKSYLSNNYISFCVDILAHMVLYFTHFNIFIALSSIFIILSFAAFTTPPY